jgi:hypothetical protein
MSRKRRGIEFWKGIAAELATSGETHKAFAARRRLSVTTLERWLGRLRRDRLAATAVSAPTRFVEVTSVETSGRAGERAPSVEVELPGGVQVRFAAGGDLAELAEAIARLATATRC